VRHESEEFSSSRWSRFAAMAILRTVDDQRAKIQRGVRERVAILLDLLWTGELRLSGLWLFHDFIGIDAPDLAALQPSGNVRGFDAAPVTAALDQMREDAGFCPGDDVGSQLGELV